MRAMINAHRDESLWLRDQEVDCTPAALTRERRLGPIARARLTWHATDYLEGLEALITAPRLVRCVTIAVMSPKGGVGKTTVTTLLGTLLAQLRRDRIVAIDTNPDYGSLGRTLAPGHNVFVDDLLEVLGHPALTVAQLDTSLARAQHGLLVLPAPTDPERMARLDEQAYRRVISRLQEMVSVIVLDCGTGLWEPAAASI
jgi:Flp pilus assembly CpaE family ATPase